MSSATQNFEFGLSIAGLLFNFFDFVFVYFLLFCLKS